VNGDVFAYIILAGVLLVVISLAVDVVHRHRHRHWPRRITGVCVRCVDDEMYERGKRESA